MNDKMHLLLDKIGFSKENYDAFQNSKLSKIVLTKKTNSCMVIIDSEEYLPIEVVQELENKIFNLDSKVEHFQVIYHVQEQDLSLIHI